MAEEIIYFRSAQERAEILVEDAGFNIEDFAEEIARIKTAADLDKFGDLLCRLLELPEDERKWELFKSKPISREKIEYHCDKQTEAWRRSQAYRGPTESNPWSISEVVKKTLEDKADRLIKLLKGFKK